MTFCRPSKIPDTYPVSSLTRKKMALIASYLIWNHLTNAFHTNILTGTLLKLTQSHWKDIFLASLDLEDTYYFVPVVQNDWNDGVANVINSPACLMGCHDLENSQS